ncbi:LPD7 domain-containing protein [Massilia sp. Leaf139]|uniref:LPD7 domain-containing protein n=1 Tax=Massilia sp. Leaf139 TaxID=1736272 RepID=UPI00070038DA|nr:LPD7 domain-containing protein [Massilia sp. Leaf139]KQQ96105.1 hypothetical protein ASF77_21615 [Massilia sp. Leaf139]
MSSDDTAGPTPQLPGIAADRLANPGQAIDGNGGRPDEPGRQASTDSAVAGSAKAKALAIDAEPHTSKKDPPAHHPDGREPAAAAAQAKGAPPEKPARRTRKPKADKEGSLAEDAGKAPVPKAPRKPRKAATVAEPGPMAGQRQDGVAGATRDDGIPPITHGAISFLGNPDASPADFIKLDPASRAFVEYHITNQAMSAASSEAMYQRLMATRPPVSPQAEVNAHALAVAMKQNGFKVQRPAPAPQAATAPQQAPAPRQELATAPAVSYAPRPLPTSSQSPVHARLGGLDIAAEKPGIPAIDPTDPARDTRHAYNVVATAHLLTKTPYVELAPALAADLVAGDLQELRAIMDGFNRNRALNAIRESSKAQPHYKAELDKQDPDLGRAFDAGQEARHAARQGSRDEAENSFEPTEAQVQWNQPAQAAQAAQHGASRGQSLLDRILGAARTVSTWLGSGTAPRAAADATAPAGSAKPVSLDKPAAAAIDKSTIVPDAVARRFLRDKDDYYFPDRTPAFSDRGTRLATRGAHPEVIRSLIEIAKARGWDAIMVKGTEHFRRSAWMQAVQAGLQVEGYKPTALDLAELHAEPANNTVEKGAVRERSAVSVGQPAASTGKGDAKGDDVPAKAPDPELVKKAREFEDKKPSFVVKKHPDLAPAYALLDAAKKFAAEMLPQDAREEFVALARRHIHQQITTGQPIKNLMAYEDALQRKGAGMEKDVDKGKNHEESDQGKPPREKVVARER